MAEQERIMSLEELEANERESVRKMVEDRLSEEILAGTIASGGTVIVDEEDGKLTFENE